MTWEGAASTALWLGAFAGRVVYRCCKELTTLSFRTLRWCALWAWRRLQKHWAPGEGTPPAAPCRATAARAPAPPAWPPRHPRVKGLNPASARAADPRRSPPSGYRGHNLLC